MSPTTPKSPAPSSQNPPTLLDPKNDYVFKRLFAETPELLVALINAVRSHDPPVAQVQILNPRIDPEELEGKFIVLDILAEDVDGAQFNIEMQVQGQKAWGARSVYYLASLLAQQLKAGKSYEALRPVVGIHLLDFDYFKGEGGQEQREGLSERRQGLTEQGNDPTGQPQALWHFAMRDRDQPRIMIDARLQLHLLELAKAYRVGIAQAQRGIAQGESSAGSASTLPPAPYSTALWAWILFFERWNEEEEMSAIVDAPVQQALTKLRAISADNEARRLAAARARALSIERTELHLARQEGEAIGQARGEAIGQARGREEGRAEGEAIGQARGREEGRAEGEAVGEARGRSEGRAEGEAVGEARGRSEGRAAAIREVLDALADGSITPAQLRKQLGSDPS